MPPKRQRGQYKLDSGKKKRERMQQKRERLEARRERREEYEKQQEAEGQLNDKEGIAGKHGRYALRSLFEKETKEVIEQRKRSAQEPFSRHLEQTGVTWQHYIDITANSEGKACDDVVLQEFDESDNSTQPQPEQGTTSSSSTDQAVALPLSLPIFDRPNWDYSMSGEQQQDKEEVHFKHWIKRLLTKYHPAELNYFERNVEVWRQLWRVLEMSDVVVVVTDARFPILHFPYSLYDYTTRVLKKNILVVFNKIDLVDADTLAKWVKFFNEVYPSVKVLPFTGFPCEETVTAPILDTKTRNKRKTARLRHKKVNFYDYLPKGEGFLSDSGASAWSYDSAASSSSARLLGGKKSESEQTADTEEPIEVEGHRAEAFKNQRKYERQEKKFERSYRERQAVAAFLTDILEAAKSLHKNKKPGQRTVIGTVGHPNVGKSSLINCLYGLKVVSVSSTPGHTKHLQTINFGDDITLCDCPGLVFPFVNFPRHLQIVCGLYPIAQCREPYTAVQYLCERLPMEIIYGLKKPDWYDNTDDWTAWMVTEAYAIKKGFFVNRGKGLPDTYRAGIAMLKDVVLGRIGLYFQPPPTTCKSQITRMGELPELKAADEDTDDDDDDDSNNSNDDSEDENDDSDSISQRAASTVSDLSQASTASNNGRGRGRARGRGRGSHHWNTDIGKKPKKPKPQRRIDTDDEKDGEGDAVAAQLAALGFAVDSDEETTVKPKGKKGRKGRH